MRGAIKMAPLRSLVFSRNDMIEGLKQSTTNPQEIIPVQKVQAQSAAEDIYKKKFADVEGKIKGVNLLLMGVVIVLFVGMVTLLVMVAQITVESDRNKTSVYDALVKGVYSQAGMLEQMKQSVIQQNEILEKLDSAIKGLNKLQ